MDNFGKVENANASIGEENKSVDWGRVHADFARVRPSNEANENPDWSDLRRACDESDRQRDIMAKRRCEMERRRKPIPLDEPIDKVNPAEGRHYEGKFETIDYLEYMMAKLLENGVMPNRAYDIVSALKYLSSRLNSKPGTPLELDLMKAENYIHRARTGKWLDPEFLNPFGG